MVSAGDWLLPVLGPIEAAHDAIAVTLAALGDRLALDGLSRDGQLGEDELVELVGALGNLCAVLARCAARGAPGASAERLLELIDLHQQTHADLASLDTRAPFDA
jgi:hypothetical protein